ncbi:putative repeat protein (TIGR01451 family) [Streptomyces achromogenes]|uniref:Repeat protein (TIGR01451 family) n=1 Tax=Streptomyces achromogenes TaxID=67255 RepID=A0ABU0QDV4_STRAH|nr:hypothetical protein [Streptomyces achromogenes]MDQ0688842.1 putative repeat protein (TIGR01451 family) [Streptomyces achromogenes]
MAIRTLRRRFAALGTVLGLGVAVFVTGVTPAYAQAQVELTKTHVGEFTRGGVGTYRITVRNTGAEPTNDFGTQMEDTYPPGITFLESRVVSDTTGTAECEGRIPQPPDRTGLTCRSGRMNPGDSYVIEADVFIPSNQQPCTVTNTASVFEGGTPPRLLDTASHTVNVCNGGNGGNGGGSILPINLSGLLPMYNNVTTNNNIHSPGATNVSGQTFGLNTP